MVFQTNLKRPQKASHPKVVRPLQEVHRLGLHATVFSTFGAARIHSHLRPAPVQEVLLLGRSKREDRGRSLESSGRFRLPRRSGRSGSHSPEVWSGCCGFSRVSGSRTVPRSGLQSSVRFRNSKEDCEEENYGRGQNGFVEVIVLSGFIHCIVQFEAFPRNCFLTKLFR